MRNRRSGSPGIPDLRTDSRGRRLGVHARRATRGCPGLVPGPMSPEARPSLWAEAFSPPGARDRRDRRGGLADYSRLAEVTGDPRPYLGAAALALASGDRLAARAWLEKALAGGAQAPPELLWDCGLYETLAARPDQGSGPDELALMGDAAWMSDDSSLARSRWERAIRLDPRFHGSPSRFGADGGGYGRKGRKLLGKAESRLPLGSGLRREGRRPREPTPPISREPVATGRRWAL